jgi:hypothetical protein
MVDRSGNILADRDDQADSITRTDGPCQKLSQAAGTGPAFGIRSQTTEELSSVGSVRCSSPQSRIA